MSSSPSRSRRSTAVKPRRSSGGGTANLGPIMIGVGFVVVLVFIVMNSGGPPPPAKVEEAPRKPEIGWTQERVQSGAKWLRSVANNDRIELAITTDLDAFQKLFKVGDTRLVSTLSGDERGRVKDEILEHLTKDESTRLLRDFEPFTGRLLDATMVASGTGKIELEMQPRPDLRDRFVADATIELSFGMRNDKLLIDGFKVVNLPKEKIVKAPVAKGGHDTIKKPELREIEIAGKKIKILEAELVELDHLADTPAPLRTEIDNLIAELTRGDLPARDRTRVRARLREIGKPAVPRLLTQFNNLRPGTTEGLSALTQIDALLRDMSGQAFGFSPAQTTVLANAEQNEAARVSALKQWYAWWYRYHDKPLDIAFDKEDEDLLKNVPKVRK